MQSWIAQAVGLVGAASGFIYAALSFREAWKLRRQQVLEKLKELFDSSDLEFANWYASQPEEFSKELERLLAFMTSEQATGGWKKRTINEVKDILRLVANAPDEVIVERKNIVDSKWTKVKDHLMNEVGDFR